MKRATRTARGVALALACAVLHACSPEREAPAPIAFDDEAPRAGATVERSPATEMAPPGARTTDRVGLVPEGLAEFDIQALPASLDDLKEAAKRDIGPANADAELEKLRAELGDRQP